MVLERGREWNKIWYFDIQQMRSQFIAMDECARSFDAEIKQVQVKTMIFGSLE